MARPPIHLGDELKEIGLSASQLAHQLNVPQNRISQIIAGKRSITGDTALRLGHWFKTSAQFWLNLQTAYDFRPQAQRSRRCPSCQAPRRRSSRTCYERATKGHHGAGASSRRSASSR
jgi:addiction module HigA family antidote